MTSGPDFKKKKNVLFFNILFVVVTGGLLIFLLNAPEETTAFLPKDDNHAKFSTMHKKEAEKFCESCHSIDGGAPLPEGHPPKYRCLFCHKKK